MSDNILQFSYESGERGLAKAKVLEADTRRALLLKDNRVLEASLASSLILTPAPGDTVLVFEDGDGAYLLSILQRGEEGSPGLLRVPAKSSLSVEDFSVSASKVSLLATETKVRSSALELEGVFCHLNFSVISQIASRIMATARNLFTRARSLEIKAESGNIRADNLKIDTNEDFRATAGLMDFKAKGSFRVDGRIINLG